MGKPRISIFFSLLISLLTCMYGAFAQVIEVDCESDTLVCHPESCGGKYSINESWIRTYKVSDPEKVIKIEFLSFSLEEIWDYIKIYDGDSIDAELIGTYSGKDSPGMVVSTGQYLTLEFFSSESVTDEGWSARVGCLEKIPVLIVDGSLAGEWCYPFGCTGNYPDNIDTLFTFRAPEFSQKLRMVFDSFDLPDPSDILEVYDGYSIEAPFIGQFTGTTIPDTILSTGAYLTFRFVSGPSENGTGWAGQILPVNLISQAELDNTVSFQGGEMVFRSLDTDQVLQARYWLSSPQGDTVSFYNGDSNQSPILRTSSGIFEYYTLISSGPYLTIRSTPHDATVDLTLRLFSIRKPEPDIIIECGQQGLGICNPPTCTGSYEENLGYIQTYRLSDTSAIMQLTFDQIRMDPHPDNLKIYDGPSVNSPLLIEICQGCESVPNSILSSGPEISFEFHSDGKTQSENAGWESILKCTEKLQQQVVYYGETLDICFPGNCTGQYQNGLDSVMVFVAEETIGGIEAGFTSFRTEGPGDFLEIYDGYSTDAPLIGRYSGSRIPETVLSSGLFLTFRFVTDGAVVGPGWKAELKSHEIVPCQDFRLFSSSSENRKTFRLAESNGILDAEFFTDLRAGDTVFFYDGSSAVDPLLSFLAGPHSREDGEFPVRPTGQFLTYDAVLQDPYAFHLYSLALNCILPEPEIVINCSESNYICHPQSCIGDYSNFEYFVQTYSAMDERAWLAIDIERFNVEKGYDTLKIYDGNSLFSPLIGFYTGDSIPDRILTSGPSVTFEFYSDQLITDEGWRMRFRCVIPEATDEADSLALVELFNNTDGPQWNTPWTFEDPVYLWPGIVVQNRRVTGIDLSNNNLTGHYPESLCTLTALQQLDLSSNQLEGSIPDCTGNLSELRTLDLGNNCLGGYLPQEFGKLVNLTLLDLSDNAFAGSLGISVMGNSNISSINISNNRLIDVVRTNTPSLQWLNVEENYLDFADVSNNLFERGTFQYIYERQKPTGNLYFFQPGSSHIVEPGFNRSSNTQDITYHWYVNSVLAAWDQPTFEITGMDFSDVGVYECRATHLEVPGMELSHVDTIEIEPGIPRVDAPRPFCVGGSNIILSELGENGQQTLWFGDSLLTDTLGIGQTIRINIKKDSDTIYVVNSSGFLLSDVLEILLLIRPTIRVEGEQLLTMEIPGAKYSWYYEKALLESEHSHGIGSRGDGEYFVSVSLDECLSTSRSTIIENNEIVQVMDHLLSQKIKVFPNPTDGFIHVEVPGYGGEKLYLCLYDLTGTIQIESVLSENHSAGSSYFLDMGALPPGAYFLKIESEMAKEVHLIIKD